MSVGFSIYLEYKTYITRVGSVLYTPPFLNSAVCYNVPTQKKQCNTASPPICAGDNKLTTATVMLVWVWFV